MNHGALVERLVSGKMNRQQFADAETTLVKKKTELDVKMKQLLASL